MTYTIGGIKGGSGKSTIATNLTIMLARHNKDVLLIDADDQATSMDFTNFRSETLKNIEYTAIKLSDKAVRDQTLKLKDKYDHIIIDTGGRDTTSQRAAISICDVFLIPFAPRSFDIWTLDKVANIVEEMRSVNPNIKCFSFLNKADPRGTDNMEVETFLKQNEIIKFIDTPIGNRKAFSNAASKGLGVEEVKPKDIKAIGEMEALFKELEVYQNEIKMIL